MRKYLCLMTALFFIGAVPIASAQVEGEEDEEDYSMYDDLDFAGEGTKRFCTSKIKGLSPAKLISIGYDVQGPFDITAGAYEGFAESTQRVELGHGLRVFANVPLISRNNIIVQGGLNHWDHQLIFADEAQAGEHPLHQSLREGGLRTTGVNTTVFKPLNETSFLLFQASADVNGNYTWSNFQSPKYATYSGALLWGKKANDRKQWAVGLSRTYRAGELNYIPVFLFNWTSVDGKWGTEMLLPARGHVRYSFSPRSMLFAGFELEGQSYRLNNGEALWNENHVELRRSELRFRLMYERSLVNFIWISVQAGYRVNYLYDVDELEGGQEFFRGFFGDQPYLVQNSITNPLYFNISLNLVSP